MVPPALMSFILLLQRPGPVSRHPAAHVHRVSTTSGRTGAFPAPGADQGLSAPAISREVFSAGLRARGTESPQTRLGNFSHAAVFGGELKDAGGSLPASALD